LLCPSSSTASDPQIYTYFHIPEAGSCPGAFAAGLQQQRVGGYSCPPNPSIPVSSKCSGTADLQSETLQSHHRRTRQPSLASGPERIQYKIAVLSYKVLHDAAPRPLTRVADIHCTWSMSTPLCQHRSPGRTSFQTFTIGGRAFPVAASLIWNSLPGTVVSASLRSFQHQLKTFIFSTINYPSFISTVIVVSQ